tara:strand:- start:23 stop:250 length:228 start_codon:yes stop_codon:yes gene_type:complete
MIKIKIFNVDELQDNHYFIENIEGTFKVSKIESSGLARVIGNFRSQRDLVNFIQSVQEKLCAKFVKNAGSVTFFL